MNNRGILSALEFIENQLSRFWLLLPAKIKPYFTCGCKQPWRISIVLLDF